MTFQEQLGLWLANRATTDAEFAKDFAKKNKSVKDCVKYIEAKLLQKVMDIRQKSKDKSQCSIAAPTDDEVYAMALEYYGNDDIKLEPTTHDMVKILSFSATTFTEEEKAKMHEEAKQTFISKERQENAKNEHEKKKEEQPKTEAKKVELKPTPKAKETKNQKAEQLSLF